MALMFWKFIRILAEMSRLINFTAASLKQERKRNYYSTKYVSYRNINAMIQYSSEKSILQLWAIIFLSIHNDQGIFIQFNYLHYPRMEINFHPLEIEKE